VVGRGKKKKVVGQKIVHISLKGGKRRLGLRLQKKGVLAGTIKTVAGVDAGADQYNILRWGRDTAKGETSLKSHTGRI